MKTMLEVTKLDFYYDKFQALKEVSFSVNKGESVALIGPNGAGKTTIVRCIMGFFQPNSGKINVFGLDPYLERSQVVNEVGYLPENAGVYSMTLKKFLLLFAGLRDLPNPEESAVAVAKLFNLHDVFNKNVAQFSQGMKQRAKFASVILHNPDLLILDEPSANLDLAAKEDLISLLGELKSLKRTLVVCSHDPYIVENVCERMILLAEGEKVFDGPFDLDKWKSLARRNIPERDVSWLRESTK
ncbi:ABC transporter ATP-binding protein [Dehalococcoidia bacterium]|nr:ABC transporter ATP-binding protein [Dehalococcoidia bacterium]